MGVEDRQLPWSHLARLGLGVAGLVVGFELVSGFSWVRLVSGLIAGTIYLTLFAITLAFVDRRDMQLWALGLAGGLAASIWSYIEFGTLLLAPLGIGILLGVIVAVWELQER